MPARAPAWPGCATTSPDPPRHGRAVLGRGVGHREGPTHARHAPHRPRQRLARRARRVGPARRGGGALPLRRRDPARGRHLPAQGRDQEGPAAVAVVPVAAEVGRAADARAGAVERPGGGARPRLAAVRRAERAGGLPGAPARGRARLRRGDRGAQRASARPRRAARGPRRAARRAGGRRAPRAAGDRGRHPDGAADPRGPPQRSTPSPRRRAHEGGHGSRGRGHRRGRARAPPSRRGEALGGAAGVAPARAAAAARARQGGARARGEDHRRDPNRLARRAPPRARDGRVARAAPDRRRGEPPEDRALPPRARRRRLRAQQLRDPARGRPRAHRQAPREGAEGALAARGDRVRPRGALQLRQGLRERPAARLRPRVGGQGDRRGTRPRADRGGRGRRGGDRDQARHHALQHRRRPHAPRCARGGRAPGRRGCDGAAPPEDDAPPARRAGAGVRPRARGGGAGERHVAAAAAARGRLRQGRLPGAASEPRRASRGRRAARGGSHVDRPHAGDHRRPRRALVPAVGLVGARHRARQDRGRGDEGRAGPGAHARARPGGPRLLGGERRASAPGAPGGARPCAVRPALHARGGLPAAVQARPRRGQARARGRLRGGLRGRRRGAGAVRGQDHARRRGQGRGQAHRGLASARPPREEPLARPTPARWWRCSTRSPGSAS